MRFVALLAAFLSISGSEALIIPDELPSILSIIYSNIPTLKKGTDSRLGWGFRLGDRADFQVLVELGPQQNTQPLANQGDEGGASKRNSLNSLADKLYAQAQHKKKEEKEQEPSKSENGSQWLQKWGKQALKSKDTSNETLLLNAKPGLAIGEIDAKSVIPEDPLPIKVKKPAKRAEKRATNQSLVSILTSGENVTGSE